MNVSLTPELEELVNQKVASGMYHSASEVIREALRLFKEQEDLKQRRLQELRDAIKIGLNQLEQGQGIPGDQVFEELRQRSRDRRSKKV